MRAKKLRLSDFKRFHDLTIDLADHPTKIVALVGPNGTGKSSVFDAFEEIGSNYKGRGGKPSSYFQKSLFDAEPKAENYNLPDHVQLETDQDGIDRMSFYIRSAYRFTPRLGITQIRTLPDVTEDNNRPRMLIDNDVRLQENYERLVGGFFDEVYGKKLNGEDWEKQNVDKINAILANILDIKISSIGNPVKGQGSLYFEKGVSKKFPYENLSAGEKEVVDLVLDLYVKAPLYPNGIICIDEPELHLNTAIQRKMLIELEKLVPENSQLWVATHSIGFLRALQEELRDKTAVLDFTGIDFDAASTVKPIAGTRAEWARIFATALEDLTGLLAPRRIIYCEGRPDPGAAGEELGLDASIYNQIFERSHDDTLFVSSGGGGAVQKNSLLALKVLGKALGDVGLNLLKDRDELSEAERNAFIAADPAHRMLLRREVENYVFDKEVVKAHCARIGTVFDEARYDAAVADIVTQDLKLVQQEVKAACGAGGTVPQFKLDLAKSVLPTMALYVELESVIFP